MPHDPHGAGAVVGHRFDAKQAPAHPDGPHALEPDEHRRGPVPLEARDGREVAAVLVAKGQGQQEVRDGREAGRRQPTGTSGTDTREPGDRIARAEPIRGASAGRVSYVSGARKVSETSPNLSTSPLAMAIGTPVARRLPFTCVPFMTPISSMT